MRKRQGTFFDGYRIYLLVMLVAIYACNFVDRMIVSVVAQPIKAEMRLSDAQIGWLSGFAFASFYAVMAIPLARLAERKQRVAIITVCMAAWSLFTAAGAAAQSFFHLLLSRIGVGIGEAGLVAPAQSLLADEFPPQHRATAISIFSLGPPIGSMVGGLVGGYLTHAYGWRAALVLVGLPGLALSAIAWWTLREPERGRWDPATGARATGASLWSVTRKVCTRPTLALITFTGICTNFAGFGVVPFLPSFMMRRFGATASEAGLAVGLLMGIGGMLGALLGGPISQWIGNRYPRCFLLFPAIGFLIAVPLLALGFSQQTLLNTAVLLMIPQLLLYTWLGPAFSAVHNLTGPRERASTVAIIYLLMSFIGMGLGPVFAGAMSDFFTHSIYGAAYASDCGNSLTISEACSYASVEGLRRSMIVTSLVLLLAFISLSVASLTLSRDRIRETNLG